MYGPVCKSRKRAEASSLNLHDKNKPASAGFRLLIKKEKAWFFLLCGSLPKINLLILLLILG
ncbi:hypothetical protein E2L00_04300 [Cedecea colo]|uniref:Uncharacterized protein n=1 Tax=Cedecea colo TaxID=2552946 RepID=A0ABX0VKT5_9ENTR|nr:hypothetical protein [Cedecea colo]